MATLKARSWRWGPYSIFIVSHFLFVCGLHSTSFFFCIRRHPNRLGTTAPSALHAHGPLLLPSAVDNISKEDAPESNFWYSVSRSPEVLFELENPSLPSVPTLDKNGPLPRGAYYSKPIPNQYGPKKVCRISAAIDLSRRRVDDELDEAEIVKNMQNFVESGLTSFQLKSSTYSNLYSWAIDSIYGRFYTETPSFITDRCHLTVPYVSPGEDSFGTSRSSVRAQILDILGRIGAEAIDEIQLQYRPESPYHLDVLDCLKELQLEGYVMSVSTQNFSPTLLRAAKSCGFDVSSSQMDMNLLEPSMYSMEQRLVSEDLAVPLVVAYPLASGLLTNRFLGMREMPYLWRLMVSERNCINTILEKWGRVHNAGPENLWQKYQEFLLHTLEEISFKHGVTVASVVLRWTLQLEHVDETVVSCRLHPDEWGAPTSKPRHDSLREVFTFALDEEDVARLWDISGRRDPDPVQSEYDDEFLLEAIESGHIEPWSQTRNEHKIDFSDRRLWL